MADGRAAISFRSYYAGTAVVEAVSPGLKPSRVSISFTGAPRYEKGITPSVKERPYIRFVSGAAEKKEQLFGLNNPVFASTWQEQRMAGMAADGNKDSYWQAVKNDPAAYWLLDTEKGLEFTHLSITFPEEACYQYKIEVSADRKEWKLVEDGMDNRTPETGKEIRLAGRNLKGRFVRITFGQLSGTSAALAEVAVKGIVCQ